MLRMSNSFHVLIIGAGLGGLVCAIACRREGLSVTVLERAPEILPIGAGIQIPPNASKILENLELLPAMRKTANEIKALGLRRYTDGSVLAQRPIRNNTPWFVIHRADYHDVLLTEARRLGAELILDAEVVDIGFATATVHLKNGTTMKGDIVVGADGLWSTTRNIMLGKASEPTETGDLAYRGTFTIEQLQELGDPVVDQLCREATVTLWMGPDKHVVFYPIRSGTQFNMVLLRPDDLPSGTRTVKGDIEEMRHTFKGWDPVLTKIINCIPSVLKWKLLHHAELQEWTKNRTVLLGDACHPTLPYQAQGAAMAVEDGAIIGKLLGLLNWTLLEGTIPRTSQSESISAVFKLYEACQKRRTTENVQGAVNNRRFYHMHDGQEQQSRDTELAKHTFTDEKSTYNWCNMEYNKKLLDVDVLGNARTIFNEWLESAKQPSLATRL